MTATSTARPTRPRPKLRGLVVVGGLIWFTIFAAREVGFTFATFWEIWTNPLWEAFWPVRWDWVLNRRNVIDPLIETFQIAIIATLIGGGLALPISFAVSRLTAPNWVTYSIAKMSMNVTRAIPDLFLALIFVTAIGFGAFAGALALSIFSLAVMVKLFSETIDGADPGPLEAARAAGARHWPAVRTGVLPTVFPAYVAYALYIFELNIRASIVIGLVGAGGIGRVVEAQRQFFRYDRILGILIIIFAIVIVIEQISVYLRKRLV